MSSSPSTPPPLNSHFLFNALNTLLSVIDENPETAKGLILSLADYLRAALAMPGTIQPLAHQWRAVEGYLRIEKARHEEAFAYAMEARPEVLAYPAPLFLLAATEEVLRGIVLQDNRRTLRIDAAVKGGRLRVGLSSPSAPKSPGELRRALAPLAPPDAIFFLDCAGGETRIMFEVPGSRNGEGKEASS